jgi:AbrB family looped-hinge helix DNA binding protein
MMKIVTISSKQQITLPNALRDRFGLQPGDQVKVWVERGSIRLKPVKPVIRRNVVTLGSFQTVAP